MNCENENVEYKVLSKDGKLPDSFVKEVVGFANSNGGCIYVGIADDGHIVGVDDPDEVKTRISSTIRDSIRPELLMFIHVVDEVLDGKHVIKVDVQRGAERPYYIKNKGIKSDGVYLRCGSATIPVSDPSIKQMLMETSGRSFEKERSIEQSLTFKSLEQEMKNRGLKIDPSKMQTLGLIGSDNLYTNLALLLSDQCPYTIKVAVFEGEDSLIFKDRREFGGSVLDQLDKTLEYIDLNNKTHSNIGAKYREDKRDYPTEAIREALLNCIVHRDYSFSSSSIINIYSDHIEFISIGSIVSGISLAAIMQGVSQSRNPLLAQLFYRLSLVESYGTGIKKIKRLYMGYKDPEFSAETGGFFVKLYNRNEHKKTLKSSQGISGASRKEQMVIDFVKKQGSVSRSEIETLLSVKQTGAFNILKEMCEKGILIQITEGKFTRYELSECESEFVASPDVQFGV